jgi:hypothetical protein
MYLLIEVDQLSIWCVSLWWGNDCHWRLIPQVQDISRSRSLHRLRSGQHHRWHVRGKCTVMQAKMKSIAWEREDCLWLGHICIIYVGHVCVRSVCLCGCVWSCGCVRARMRVRRGACLWVCETRSARCRLTAWAERALWEVH